MVKPFFRLLLPLPLVPSVLARGLFIVPGHHKAPREELNSASDLRTSPIRQRVCCDDTFIGDGSFFALTRRQTVFFEHPNRMAKLLTSINAESGKTSKDASEGEMVLCVMQSPCMNTVAPG